MFRHRTKAALAVLSFPGAEPRQGTVFTDHGGGGVGLPHVRCRLADQYGIGGAESTEVSMDPFVGLSSR